MYRYIFIAIVAVMFTSCGESTTHVLVETNIGNMKLRLYDSTPGHRDNMVKLVNEGFYDGLLFHRVIKNFMVQGGDPNSKGATPNVRLGGGGPGYQIDAEIGAPHIRGAIAAARTPDGGNPQKRSSGSQFYLVYGRSVTEALLNSLEKQKGIKYSDEQKAIYAEKGGYPSLDNDYTVFGELVEGMDILEKIQNVETAPGDRPLEDIVMTKVTVVK